jgi:ankyrin repeat protein
MASSSSQSASISEVAVKGEALVKAALAGNINEVTRLLGKKADINYVNKWIIDGEEVAQTPLTAAIGGGHANLAEPCMGWTALFCASCQGNRNLVELLMSKGAKHDVRNHDGSTPLHLVAVGGHKEAVACLLDLGADINNEATHSGMTPLMIAANEGRLETVKLLVHKGADLKKRSSGLTALDMAAFKGHDKVVDFLINAGARFDEGGTVAKNCNACGKEDPGNILKCIGCKAIHYCCEECQRSDWKNHKAQCRNIKATRDRYKDKSKIEEEMETRFKKFNMEES